jgi:hypothetical protein
MTEVDKVIKRFRDYVIQQARSNLTKELYNSIKGEIVTDKGFSIVGFSMDEHGAYQDKGVKGATSSMKAPNSPYRFGSGTGKEGGLRRGIDKWVRLKRLRFRSKIEGSKGRFLSYQETASLITRSIFHKGIKPSLFFTKPFEAGYKKYIDVDLLKAFGEDMDTIIDFNLK